MLAFLNGGEEGRTLYNAFVTGQVCYEVYKRLTVSQADVLRVGFALCQFKVTMWPVLATPLVTSANDTDTKQIEL